MKITLISLKEHKTIVKHFKYGVDFLRFIRENKLDNWLAYEDQLGYWRK
ncbi:MAG: hypothetical protein J6Z11_12525 [Candidatus Riflebacteria bacterium]|nr:hypothetical protein [Candidatus Riflebacteria bacterium]